MNQKKVLVFDFDGTVADSTELEHRSLLNAIHQYGHEEINDDNLEQYFGPTESGIIKHIVGEDDFAEAWLFFIEDYVQLQSTLLKSFAGMKELLEQLSQRDDLTLILVTGRSRGTLDISLDYLGYSSFFKATYTGSEEGINKDESILQLMKDFSFNKEDIVYIGDTASDVRTMRKADIDILSAGYSHFQSDVSLEELNPGNVAHSVAELKKKLEEITK